MAFFVAASPEIISSQSHDPFAFLSPTIQISAADLARVERGEVVVNTLPARGQDVSVLAIATTTMTPERLAAWAADIERLKATPQVLRVKKLSAKPALDEFAQLTLPDADIRDVRSCRPGSCNVKLTQPEIERMRREMQTAGMQWLARGNEVFREIARDRVTGYLAGGHAALSPYADGHGEPSRATAFAGVIANSPFLQKLQRLSSLLARPSSTKPSESESFVYWSVEQLGAKAVASATETIITTSADPNLPPVVIAGKQIYATHYSSASLNVTALVPRHGAGGAPYYFVVVNRSSIDALGGFFGAITRKIVESRIRRDTPDIVLSAKQRIESGPPKG